MKTRLLIHYLDGKTFTGEWNKIYDFRNLNNKPISSLQIQKDIGKTHTLSSKKKQKNIFWQRDKVKTDRIICRSVLKRLTKDVWLDLTVDCETGNSKIVVIKENIRIN